ncbi:MAG: glycosyltransferase [Phycisphaerae bacterium]|nr:glycosyltransferase [Phycisphaerae bacterium]NLG44730.1 glycosyltransferase family 4 protein [Phycisphaerae bacterium]
MSTDQLAESLLRRHLNGRNVVVFAKNLGPYHVARFRVLGRRLAGYGAHLVGVELAAAEKAYPWRVSRDALEFQWRTLASDGAVEDISGWGQRRLTRKCLEELQPVVTVVPGWSDAFLRYALAWCRSGPGICLVAGDSTADTRRTDYEPKRRLRLLELYKRWLLRGVDGALVSGDASRDYFASLGVPRERIFLKYDVVDNEYIAQRAEQARRAATSLRVQYKLPQEFFFYPARLLRIKNHFRLLEAYELYLQRAGDSAWGLVMLGDGPAAQEVDAAIARLGCPKIVRRPFAPLEVTADHYGLASALVFPSLRETWGLIVNEAAAAGLPLLVARNCPATDHLVLPGQNGWHFDPERPAQLAELFWRMSSLSVEDRERMGAISRQVVATWGLEGHVDEVLKAVAAAMQARGWTVDL